MKHITHIGNINIKSINILPDTVTIYFPFFNKYQNNLNEAQEYYKNDLKLNSNNENKMIVERVGNHFSCTLFLKSNISGGSL